MEFPEDWGGGRFKSSVGDVWIFSGAAHFMMSFLWVFYGSYMYIASMFRALFLLARVNETCGQTKE